MEGFRFIESIRLQNVLSFGPDGVELPLEPLNVLIGPNGSGKSNLIEVLSLFAAAPRDIQAPIRQGGGPWAWTWMGQRRGNPTVQMESRPSKSGRTLRHEMRFRSREDEPLFAVYRERILRRSPDEAEWEPLYEFEPGKASLYRPVGKYGESLEIADFPVSELKPDQSVLSRIKDPLNHREMASLGRSYENIAIYRDFDTSPSGPLRSPQPADLFSGRLAIRAENLGLVLSRILNVPTAKNHFLTSLRKFLPRANDVRIDTQSSVVRVFVHEDGLSLPTPAARLSDGTLRYLCLLAILSSSPGSLVCVEEPELGLHPDAIPLVAELLLDAATHTQLVVTTHSPALVDALSRIPESVVVCEYGPNGTSLRRLDPKRLESWLKKYRLGELWERGDLGGNPP